MPPAQLHNPEPRPLWPTVTAPEPPHMGTAYVVLVLRPPPLLVPHAHPSFSWAVGPWPPKQ